MSWIRMMAGEVKFGAYVPTVPDLDKIAALDSEDDLKFERGYAIPPKWTALELVSIRVVNHDGCILKLALPPGRRISGQGLQLLMTEHLLVLASSRRHGGNDAVRPYTSIHENIEVGTFSILVKRYQQWGEKSCVQRAHNDHLFLFSSQRIDHSYRPAAQPEAIFIRCRWVTSSR